MLCLYSGSALADDIEQYQQILSDPQSTPYQSAVARHQLGFALLQKGQPEAAIQLFRQNQDFHRAKGDLPSLANYHLYAAQAAESLGDIPTAESEYQDALAIWPLEDPDRMLEVIQGLLRIQQYLGKQDQLRETLDFAKATLPVEIWESHLADKAKALGFDPNSNLKIFTILLLSLGLIVGLTWQRTRAITLNLSLVVASIGLAIWIAELVLAKLNPPTSIRYLLHSPNTVSEFVPAEGIMPGVDYQLSRFTTNAAGLRGEPLPADNRPRYLFIGGSSTENLYLDDNDAWPLLVQHDLSRQLNHPIWVGNAGKSGLNSFSHRAQLAVYSPTIRPEVVVVQAGINDLNQCISGGRTAVKDNARKARYTGFEQDYTRHVFQEIKPANAPGWFPTLQRTLDRLLQTPPQDSDDNAADFVTQDTSGTFYSHQRERRQQARKVSTSPDIKECLEAYTENMRYLVRLSRQFGYRLHFLTQGSLYRDDLTATEESLLWFGSIDTSPFSPEAPDQYYSSPVMKGLLDAYNRQTLKLCTEYQLSCLDVDKHVEQTTSSYYDDVHLNIQGSRQLANAVTRLLVDQER
ncbi:MAG: GDSL-type esterase/lipase family protein [bacterium]